MGKYYIIKVTCLCLGWYASSSFNNVIGKQVLNQFEYPMTLTLIQLLCISILSEPLLRLTYRNTSYNRIIPPSIFWKIIIPLAFGKFIASVSSHVSIWKVPVSFAHTIKATMPLFTVALGRLIFGETHSRETYVSLFPIILGVVIATLTEFNFSLIGLLSALIATLGFSLQNIFSKQVLKSTSIHQFQLLATLARISLLLFLPFWLLFDGWNLINYYSNISNTTENYSKNYDTIIFLLILDGILNFIQNILAFSVLSLVTPLTYSVANASKRIAIISSSLLFFRNPVSFYNLFGISIAIFGVFLYNRAKHLEKSKTYIPLYNNNYI